MGQLETMSLSENESPEIPGMQEQISHGNAEEDPTQHSEDLPLINPDGPPDEESLTKEASPEEMSLPQAQDEDSLKSRDRSHRQHFEKFLSDLEKLQDTESKLQFTVEFMESSLAQTGTPHFKSFWEARNVCLQLFKENIPPALRSLLWTKYNELSKEARRLKEILDEQSAFAVEQIEIAVKALESDILSFDEQLHKIEPLEFTESCRSMDKRLPHYQMLQNELNLLNTHASRINALRKELIRTEMRVRQKNKFFQRLSIAGDKVFPRRKELIKEVSNCFLADVDGFVNEHFSERGSRESLFNLREEIKALQNMAKILTLNTHSFTLTRKRLSECWDCIKNEEKERKKERTQLKAVFKQNLDEAMQRLESFNQAYQAGLSVAEANKQLDEITSFFRTLELGRDEQRELREAFNAARKPLLDKIQNAEQERHHQEIEREKTRRSGIQEIKQGIDDLLMNGDAIDAETLAAERERILEKISTVALSKAEKFEIERQLKPLRDLITEKKESSIMALSEDDRQSLQQLKDILKQRKERRQEIKNQIEIYRKASGSSGLDFEQAMSYNLQMTEEKERLEKIMQGVKEIEEKIAKLEKR